MNRLIYQRPKFWEALLYIGAMGYFGTYALFHPSLVVNFSASYIVLMAGGMVASTALKGEGAGASCWVRLTAGAVLSAAIAALLAIASFVALTWWLSPWAVCLATLPLAYVLASIRTTVMPLGMPPVAPLARMRVGQDDNDYYEEGV